MKIIDLGPEERAITFQPTEILDTRTVVKAFVRSGFTRERAKVLGAQFFDAIEEFICDRHVQLEERKKRLLMRVEKRRRDAANKRVLTLMPKASD
jgi:hypothetical protein